MLIEPLGRRKNVAILCPDPPGNVALNAMAGIARYNLEHGRWRFHSTNGLPILPPELVPRWHGDGLLMIRRDEAVNRIAKRRNIPLVWIGASRLEDAGLHAVTVDYMAVGRIVAECFLEKGLSHFTAIRSRTLRGDEAECLEGFEQALSVAGQKCDQLIFHQWLAKKGVLRARISRFGKWLADQSWPVGLFLLRDHYARDIVEVLQGHGISIPEDAAIVGVRNNPLICEIDAPLLSSVDLGFERLGYFGAQMLDGLMNGAEPPERYVVFPPVGIVERHSSDILAVKDPVVRRALGFIRERACYGANVSDMIRELRLDRRMLERKIRETLGRTLLEEIHRVRTHMAKRLLSTTDLPIARVSEACGYATQNPMEVVFKRLVGVTPTEYRLQQRAAAKMTSLPLSNR